MSELTLNDDQKNLRRRFLEISYLRRLTHLGSSLSAIDLIDAVYQVKNKNDVFVLSAGHAAFAWYVLLEKYGFLKEEDLMLLNIHPDRNLAQGIAVSTGSLGQGLPIAVGLSVADQKRHVYCLISDGECAEGSIWESLRIIQEQKINNIIVIVNANGFGAYDPISSTNLTNRLAGFGFTGSTVFGHDIEAVKKALSQLKARKETLLFAKTINDQLPFLNGLDAHYYLMTQKDYQLSKQVFS